MGESGVKKIRLMGGEFDGEYREVKDDATKYPILTPPEALHLGDPGSLPLQPKAGYGFYTDSGSTDSDGVRLFTWFEA
jgi:hypothetical protein